MSLAATIKEATAKAIEDIYKLPAFADDVLVNQTKPEFEGDYTVVLFAFVKKFKNSPEKL
jgi:arginyl-tRNA synthetase